MRSVKPDPEGSCRQRQGWRDPSLAAVAILFVAAASDFLNPIQMGFLPPCVFHKLTALYCPGCGTTRAIHQLLHGHLGAALRLNLLAVLLLPLLGWWAVWQRDTLWKPWLGWTLLGVVLMFGAVRNVPHYPFTLLAP